MANNDDIQAKIFGYAYSLLARKRYTAAEIDKKLESKFPQQTEAIEEIIRRLKENHYLDDTEYARLFIESRLRSHPQSIKLTRWDLRRKGLNAEVIEHAFGKEDVDELEMARQAAQKKQKSLKHLPEAKKKEKMYRFLLSRGFSPSIIFQIPFYKNDKQ